MSERLSPPSSGLPPPGWYVDPVRPAAGYRWWDGWAWTTQVVPFSQVGEPQAAPHSPAPPTPQASPPPPAPPGAAPGPGDRRVIPMRAIWYAVIALVAGEALGAVLAGIAYAFTGRSQGAVVTVLGEIGLWVGMFGGAVYVSRRYGTRSLARDFGLRIRFGDIGLGVVVAIIGTILSTVGSAAFAGTRFAGTNTQILTGQRHNSAGIAVVTVIVAVGAPFFEELFFRGVIRTALASRFGPAGTIVGQGLLFGAAHYVPGNGLGNVSVIVTIALLGMVLGYAATRTGRLGAGMIGHGLFNLVAAIVVITS